MEHGGTVTSSNRLTPWIATAGLATVAVAIALGPGRTVVRLLGMPLHDPGNWQAWVNTVNGVGLITVLASPVAALVVWVRARRTGAWRRSVAEVGIVYGTIPWVWLTMMPGSGAGSAPARVSLVPLRDLGTMDNGQIIGNLLVLAALGFFTPMRFKATLLQVLVLAAACSVLIETAQYGLRLDRVSSVDDVLLNTAGAGLAALASRPWWRDQAVAVGVADGGGAVS